MTYHLRRAEPDDREFARELTCRNMLRYYIEHDLLWQDEAFDVAWDGRDNWLIILDEVLLGFSASVGIVGRCTSASCK